MTELTDDDIWTLCELGYRLYTRDRDDDAVEIFRGLVALEDRLAYPWHALGVLARRRDDLRRAIECFQRRLDLEPGASRSRLLLAETLYQHGHHRDAADVLRHFQRHPDDNSRAARRGRVLLSRWESLG